MALSGEDEEFGFGAGDGGVQPAAPLVVIHFGKPFFKQNHTFSLTPLRFVHGEGIPKIK